MSEIQVVATDEVSSNGSQSVSKAPEASPATPPVRDEAKEAAPRRRLLSLSAQKERLERPQRPPAAKPHLDDPMARAMELLSGIDENVRAAEQEAGSRAAEVRATPSEAPVVRGEGSASWRRPASSSRSTGPGRSEAAARPVAANRPRPATSSGASTRPPVAGSPRVADGAFGFDPASVAGALEALGLDPTVESGGERPLDELRLEDLAAIGAAPVYEEVVRTEDASPVVAKETRRSPARALYSLQEVHERTDIPYATLALYAASHAAEIPSLGERRSPAYPREGLEAFCRIHAAKHPGWTAPEAGTEEGWDDESGLAQRLDALADGLEALRADVEEIEGLVRRGWTAEVSLFD